MQEIPRGDTRHNNAIKLYSRDETDEILATSDYHLDIS